MLSNDELVLEQCRRLLKQAAWRLQYHTRMQHLREPLTLSEFQGGACNFDEEVVSGMYVQELTNTIPSEKCRYIFQKVVIEGIPEKDIASELCISQQGVSKWKRKGIEIIRYNLIHSQNH